MEFGILIGIIVVGLGLYMWNTRKREEVQPAEEPAPYKVETKPESAEIAPVVQACGCGRSSTGYCVGLHKLTTEEWAVHADNPNRTVVTEVKKPVKAKKPRTPKVVAKKAGAKKTRATKA